jgi:outer membrane protein OmpA-like peptidoglycan-associated protein
MGGEPVVVSKKDEKSGKEKQRFVMTATGDGKAFATAVVEIDPEEINGAKKIRAKKPMEIQTIKKGEPIRLNDVNFATNSSVLNGMSMDVLDELVMFLKAKNTMKIAIHGHTDNRGNAQTNLTLSKGRAKEVMEFLIASGIDKSRLSYDGFGSQKPKSSNSTEEGRAINRRVEFVILAM